MTLHGPAIAAAQKHAHTAANSSAPPPLAFFKPEQAAEIEAMAAQIIPTDDTPGAREAGVIHFIDRALATFDRDKQSAYNAGLEQVTAKVKEMFPAAARLSQLQPEQQVAVLSAIEKSEFFETVRTHTLIGMFANPSYGGNRDQAGWKLIGFEDAMAFQPPFGYYDRENGR